MAEDNLKYFDKEALERGARAAKEPAIAMGYSISANVGDRRQIVVQCHVAEDETDATVNEKLDRAMRMIDRQQAYYDLEAEMEGFDKVGMSLKMSVDALPLAAQNAAKETEKLKTELLEWQTKFDDETKEGMAEWAAKGKHGKYQPGGNRQSALNAMNAKMAQIEAALKAKPNDDVQHKETVLKSIANFQKDLSKRREKINRLNGLLGKPPVTEYQDYEAMKLD